jgi:hypothetical protein
MYPRVVSHAFCRQVARGYCGNPTTRAALSRHCLASLMQVLLYRRWVLRMDGLVEHPKSGTLLAIMIAPGEGEVQVAYMANHHGWLLTMVLLYHTIHLVLGQTVQIQRKASIPFAGSSLRYVQ